MHHPNTISRARTVRAIHWSGKNQDISTSSTYQRVKLRTHWPKMDAYLFCVCACMHVYVCRWVCVCVCACIRPAVKWWNHSPLPLNVPESEKWGWDGVTFLAGIPHTTPKTNSAINRSMPKENIFTHSHTYQLSLIQEPHTGDLDICENMQFLSTTTLSFWITTTWQWGGHIQWWVHRSVTTLSEHPLTQLF